MLLKLLGYDKPKVQFNNYRLYKWKMDYSGNGSIADRVANDMKKTVLEFPSGAKSGQFILAIKRENGSLFELYFRYFLEKGIRSVEFNKIESVDER